MFKLRTTSDYYDGVTYDSLEEATKKADYLVEEMGQCCDVITAESDEVLVYTPLGAGNTFSPETGMNAKTTRTVTLNIGTKRNNRVADNVSTISFDDIDYKIGRLLGVYSNTHFKGDPVLRDITIKPVDSDWGKEYTIVLVIDATNATSNCNGKNLSELACIHFEQEAVAYKEWENDGEWRTLIDRGLTYHINYPHNAERYEFDNAYFVDAETRN